MSWPIRLVGAALLFVTWADAAAAQTTKPPPPPTTGQPTTTTAPTTAPTTTTRKATPAPSSTTTTSIARAPTAPAMSVARTGAPTATLRTDAFTETIAQRVGYGFDVFAIVGDDLAGRRAATAVAIEALEAVAAELHQRENQRQAALEKIAVLSSDLVGARRDQQRHAGALVEVLQGSLIDVTEGMQTLWLEPRDATRQLYSNSLYDSAAAHIKATLSKDALRIALLELQLAQSRNMLRNAELALAKTGERFADAVAAVEATKAVVSEAEAVVTKLAADRRYPNLDIDLLPLDAYVRAARAAATKDPACGIEWWMLAAVGLVESNHARGREVQRNGDVLSPILGPVLDGSDENQEIKDTDGGLLDGDTIYDRAVGPMQFIPETWKRRGADGNGDGVKNVHNLYDAAFAAAVMLCEERAGDRLTTATGFGKALFAYNHSDRYVAKVLANAIDYQRSDLKPTTVVNLVASGAGATSQLLAAVTAAGLRPQVLASGDVNRITGTLFLADEYDFHAVAGPIVVIADPKWSAVEQRRVATAVSESALGLALLWVGPGAPVGMATILADPPTCRDCDEAAAFAETLGAGIEALLVRAQRESGITQRR